MVYHLSRRRAPPPALKCPGGCSATAQVVQSSVLECPGGCSATAQVVQSVFREANGAGVRHKVSIRTKYVPNTCCVFPFSLRIYVLKLVKYALLIFLWATDGASVQRNTMNSTPENLFFDPRNNCRTIFDLRIRYLAPIARPAARP